LPFIPESVFFFLYRVWLTLFFPPTPFFPFDSVAVPLRVIALGVLAVDFLARACDSLVDPSVCLSLPSLSSFLHTYTCLQVFASRFRFFLDFLPPTGHSHFWIGWKGLSGWTGQHTTQPPGRPDALAFFCHVFHPPMVVKQFGNACCPMNRIFVRFS